ncbi:hypothetical protein [Embleya sp. NPDC001921]
MLIDIVSSSHHALETLLNGIPVDTSFNVKHLTFKALYPLDGEMPKPEPLDPEVKKDLIEKFARLFGFIIWGILLAAFFSTLACVAGIIKAHKDGGEAPIKGFAMSVIAVIMAGAAVPIFNWVVGPIFE